MRLLRPGQETVVSWNDGAVECQVIAAAGQYVLLRHAAADLPQPAGPGCLTYLDGLVPMGWDGVVEQGAKAGELRFRVGGDGAADRRSSVRVPVSAWVEVRVDDRAAVVELLDVSAGGARFRCPERLRAGTVVELHTTLPGGPDIDAAAIVRQSEPGICSVQFATLSAAAEQAIGAWSVGILRASLAA